MDLWFAKEWGLIFPSFKRCLIFSSKYNIEFVCQGKFGFSPIHVEPGNHQFPGLNRNRLKNRVKLKQRISGKIHLSNQAVPDLVSNYREMYMIGPPGIVMIAPGIGTRLDRI